VCWYIREYTTVLRGIGSEGMKIKDTFKIRIGQYAAFISKENRLGAEAPSSPFEVHDINGWIIRHLKLKEFKDYKITVTVELIEEVQK